MIKLPDEDLRLGPKGKLRRILDNNNNQPRMSAVTTKGSSHGSALPDWNNTSCVVQGDSKGTLGDNEAALLNTTSKTV